MIPAAQNKAYKSNTGLQRHVSKALLCGKDDAAAVVCATFKARKECTNQLHLLLGALQLQLVELACYCCSHSPPNSSSVSCPLSWNRVSVTFRVDAPPAMSAEPPYLSLVLSTKWLLLMLTSAEPSTTRPATMLPVMLAPCRGRKQGGACQSQPVFSGNHCTQSAAGCYKPL